MNLKQAREVVLDLLRTKGRITNSEIEKTVGGDAALAKHIRETLIVEDLAEDYKGVGVAYLGPPLPPQTQNKPPAAPRAALQEADQDAAAAESKAPVFRRIFLSYGHDEHAPLVRRLKQDLEARGHEVWFDEERLQPGEDWEACIERGLEWVAAEPQIGRVILLMTPHSVRRPDGYCLNEIAGALGRSLPVVPVMVVWSEPPLSICRIQWLDMRDCVPVDQRQARYKTRVQQLIRALEHDSLDFECAAAKLHTLLDPLPFDADIAQHLARFTGRQWVFDRIDAWLRDPSASRVFWITGAPGVGKTAIAAWLCEHRREVKAFHLCRHGHAQKSNPRKCVPSLAYQLSTQLADYQDRLNLLDLRQLIAESDARTLFDRLIVQPLSGDYPRPEGIVVVLIDALDEATVEGRNELALFLATEFRRTPDWLRLVITSRSDPEVKHALQAYTPHLLNASSPDNKDDIRAFLLRELKPFVSGGGAVPEAMIEAILHRSEGIFLYVEWVRQEVTAGRLSLSEPEKFPKGLGEVYAQYVARQFPDVTAYERDVAPALDAIAAANEPLELTMLATLFGWGERRQHEFQRSLGSLFSLSGGRMLPFHKTVIDWLTDADRAHQYFVSIEEGHQRLAEACWREYRHGPGSMSQYALAHLPSHLVAAKRWDDLETLLTDLFYLEARTLAGRVFELAGDFSIAVKALPEDRPQRRILRLLEEALRRDIHFIARHVRDYPQGLLQCLWNTCWWYDCDEAAAHYFEPEVGWNEENAPWLQPDGQKLCRLLDRWRSSKDRACPGFAWLGSRRPPPIHLGTAQRAILRGHERRVTGVAFSSGGDWIASASKDTTVRVWDARTGAEIVVLRGCEMGVTSLAFSSDGDHIVSGCAHGTVHIRDRRNANEVRRLLGHMGIVNCVAYSPDGRRIASGAGSVRIWDAQSGTQLGALHGHEGSVRCLAFSPDGGQIVSGAASLRVWDAESGALLRAINDWKGFVTSVAFSADGRRIVTGGTDGTVRVWDATTGLEAAILRGHESSVESVAFSPEGTRIASCSDDGTVRVWDTEGGTTVAVLRGHEGAVRSVAFSPDGTQVASGSDDTTVRIWEAAAHVAATSLRGHDDVVTSVAFSPDGSRACSASDDRTVLLWDPARGTDVAVLRGHEDRVTSVAYSHDGTRIASASWDGTVRVWDVQNAVEVTSCRGKPWVESVAFSPNDARIASGSADCVVRVWEMASGAETAVCRGHEDRVQAVAFSPDGRRIASGSWDRTVRVWEAIHGTELGVLYAHEWDVTSVAFSPDGLQIVSESKDKTLRVWDVDRGACVEVIEGSGDVQAIAAGPRHFPLRAISHGLEIVVERAADGEPAAWFPVSLSPIVTHPSGYTWAGASGNHLYILTLEGAEEPVTQAGTTKP